MRKNIHEMERRFLTSVNWEVVFGNCKKEGIVLTSMWTRDALTLDSFKKMVKDIESIFEELNKKKDRPKKGEIG